MQKWVMSVLMGAAGLLAVILLLFNLPPKEETGPNAPITIPDTPVQPDLAEAVYASSCMGCHGDEYQGAMAPALKQVGAHMSRKQIYQKIMNGGGGMPGFKDRLSEEEIVNLTNWLSTFK